ncbi:MAG TPA: efflux RND transporter permease subunit [Myxococcaceae bacterium]|nr:efflux RND transporter permease subunit [Myxococcaceae bacterium]
MHVSEWSVRHPQFTLVMFLMLAALGASALFAIPRAEDPTFPIPNFAVVAVYPGASPEEVEQRVVDPLEESFQTLEDVKKVRTAIEDGLAVIELEFEAGVDADSKYEEVLREVNSTRPELPPELLSVDVQRFNANTVSVLQFALTSADAPYRALEDQAKRLEERLEAVPGVREASTWAYPGQELRVSLDVEKAAQLGISYAQVLGAIAGGNSDIPGGSVDAGRRRFNVKTAGEFQSLEQVGDAVVGGGGGHLVRVRDVAEVAFRDEDLAYVGRYNGERAAFVTFTQKDKQNIFTVRDRVEKVAKSFRTELPPGMVLHVAFDQAANVDRRLTGFVKDFALAIALVLLTLLPLGLRASLLVMVSIPLSLALGLAGLHAAGYSINQLSIVGLVIALGLLVDDSIVVVENINRFLRRGYSRAQAAIAASRQIGMAVLGCTATLVFAFVPVIFLPGTAGQFIRSLPMAVIFTILASLLVSLTIIPLLASLFLREEKDEHGNFFMRGLHQVIDGSYHRVLHGALARPALALAVAGALFLGSLALVPVLGFSLFPKAGLPQFLISVRTPEGASLAETDRAVRFVEGVLRKRKEVEGVSANVGKGNPRVYYNVGQSQEKATVGELLVRLNAYHPRDTPRLLDEVRKELDAYPDAKVEVREFENGPAVEAPIAIRLLGEDLGTLRAWAEKVEAVIAATPGTLYVDNPVRYGRTDLRVRVDREKAGLFGVSPVEVNRSVRLALAGLTAGEFREPDGDEIPIRVRILHGGTPTPELLEAVWVPSSSGALLPLSQLATVGLEASPSVINHAERERSVTVKASVATGYNTDRVTQAILGQLRALELPKGYRWVAAGEIESREESFGGLGSAGLIAAFGILAILILEFRTFKSTLIVASVIPLGIVGGVLALLFSGNTLSFTAAIGFIALIGIEVKNSILLVDFTNQLREEGMGLDAAIEKAGEARFVPILLTTFTALGGLLPLALEGSSLYSPLAWVIIGGLLSSTLLTRVVTPVMYKLLAPEVGSAAPEGVGGAVAGATP